MYFDAEVRQKLASVGIDIEESYKQFLLEIRVGGPAMDGLMSGITGAKVKLRASDENHQTHGPKPRNRNEPTLRELDVLRELALGGDLASVAGRVGIGIETAKTHVVNVRRKLKAKNRTHAVAIAIRRGLI